MNKTVNKKGEHGSGQNQNQSQARDQNQKTIKQLKDDLDQLLEQIAEAEPDQLESSTFKLKEAKQIIAEIEKRLKFSEVQISEL